MSLCPLRGKKVPPETGKTAITEVEKLKCGNFPGLHRNSTEQEYSTLFFQEAQTPQKLVANAESHTQDTNLLFLVTLEAAPGAPGWKPQI